MGKLKVGSWTLRTMKHLQTSVLILSQPTFLKQRILNKRRRTHHARKLVPGSAYWNRSPNRIQYFMMAVSTDIYLIRPCSLTLNSAANQRERPYGGLPSHSIRLPFKLLRCCGESNVAVILMTRSAPFFQKNGEFVWISFTELSILHRSTFLSVILFQLIRA